MDAVFLFLFSLIKHFLLGKEKGIAIFLDLFCAGIPGLFRIISLVQNSLTIKDSYIDSSGFYFLISLSVIFVIRIFSSLISLPSFLDVNNIPIWKFCANSCAFQKPCKLG